MDFTKEFSAKIHLYPMGRTDIKLMETKWDFLINFHQM